MPGQIIKRKGKQGKVTWQVRVFTGRNTAGIPQFHNHTVKGKRKDAQDYLTEKLNELNKGTFVEPSTMTVDKYLDKWLDAAAKPKLRQLTFQHYRDMLKRYVRPDLGAIKLAKLQPLDIQTLYSEMQARGLSPRIVRYAHTVLSSALKQAVAWRMITINPATGAQLPKKVRTEMNALTPEQAETFLEHAGTDRYRVLFNLAIVTGLRPSEYLGLTWKDIHFKTGVLTVQRTLTWLKKSKDNPEEDNWYFGEPKTAWSRRNIPMPPELVDLLKEHRRVQSEERLKLGPGYQNLDLVFANVLGGPLMTHNLIVRHFKPILERAGLPDVFRLYDLRHTCATLLLAAGENPKIVAERLGHSSVVITLDTYSHVLPTMQQSATDKLAEILFRKKVAQK